MAVVFKDEYLKMDEMFGGKTYQMCANTLMTWPADVDASRLNMNTSETKQSLTLLNPDIPRLSCGWENTLGKLNKNQAYKQLDGTWEVIDIIRKYSKARTFMMIFYNADQNLWDMIERPLTENLSEKFGYMYNTEVMDNLKVGDVVTDPILYKSTSYDEYGNYRYGKNAKVMYTTSTDTLEDAVRIRKGWADGVETVEVDTVVVPINMNHKPLNLYGDNSKHIYKSFPDIGEPIKDSCVFAMRPKNKNHTLSEMQNDALCHVNPATDSDFYISEAKQSFIYDIDIYYNGEEAFPTEPAYQQLREYYLENEEYRRRVLDWATQIKQSGDNYTDNIPFFKSIFEHFDDPEWKWSGKEKTKPFGYMMVRFHVVSILGLLPGSKVAGRYGDKGVVASISGDSDGSTSDQTTFTDNMLDSILDMMNRPINEEERARLADQIEIVPDEGMPYTDDFKVDIELNAPGSFRRLNPGQLDELDLNFCSYCVQREVKALPTLEEKANLIFDYLSMLTQEEYDLYYGYYKSLDTVIPSKNGWNVVISDVKAKEAFVRDIEENGFYIVKYHDTPLRYSEIVAIYDKYDFIKPLPLYIDIFGTKRRRVIKDAIIADKYMIILKHNSNKNFSARSTFHINRANLPVKDTTKRDNRSPYSKSPVRIGEAYNLMSAVTGELMAEYNIFTRSSIIGRKSLKRVLQAKGNPLVIPKLEIMDNFINANVDIFNALLKTVGIGTQFHKEGDEPDAIEDVTIPLHFGKYTIYDSPVRKKQYAEVFLEFIKRMESMEMVESFPGEKELYVWKEVFKLDNVKAMKLSKDVRQLLTDSTARLVEDTAEEVS